MELIRKKASSEGHLSDVSCNYLTSVVPKLKKKKNLPDLDMFRYKLN